MGTITFSTAAPSGETVRFQLGSAEFELSADGSYDTDSQDVLSAAALHPWLSVAITPTAPDESAAPDLNDPHVNPAADHLSASASSDVKKAAAEADAAVQEANSQPAAPDEQPTPTPAPTVVPDAAPPGAPLAAPLKAASDTSTSSNGSKS